MTNALICVDVQRDFVEGGSLAVVGGQKLATTLETVVGIYNSLEALVLYTKDWHIDPGSHFSDNPDYIDSWPSHCVAETEGASFAGEFDPEEFDSTVFYKGEYRAAYSGVEGLNSNGDGLVETLRYFGVTHVDVVGIAYDYCVRATATDLQAEGFKVNVIKDFTVSVHPENDETTTLDLQRAGVSVYDARAWVRQDAEQRRQKQAKVKDPSLRKKGKK